MSKHIIEVSELQINVQKRHMTQALVKSVSFSVPKGSIMGVVGESGSGKSIVMKSLMNNLAQGLERNFNTYQFDGKPVNSKDKLPISMIFQDPMTALNPVRTIGY
ncbi:MAG: ATP-binding cassette domain-containing protein, partial [Lactococcus plantarum]|nr:ATP-binding cassette domain-containing protein [Lactococcus plantarum]